jgi:hypothetical protein
VRFFIRARYTALAPALALAIGGAACAVVVRSSGTHVYSPSDRLSILRRAQVWSPTDVPRMDLRAGPEGAGAFAPEERVDCDFVEVPTSGRSPKFTCAIDGTDKVKVKYGRDNGEVYAEVAATRLLWALGFPADRMYPVRVFCHRCPSRLGGTPTRAADTYEFAIASIERKLAGREVALNTREGWTWPELDLIDEDAGGAPVAHRDALKLLAAVLQHTDSKSEQQRLLCEHVERGGNGERENCEKPIAMINDLGLTFGRANELNRGTVGSANLSQWSRTPVWSGRTGCVANIAISYTGTLDHPRIGEAGRQFLAALLDQLSDDQLRDLFETARFEGRNQGAAERGRRIEAWVDAFKTKREEIDARRCE